MALTTKKMKFYWITAGISGLIFFGLFALRLDIFTLIRQEGIEGLISSQARVSGRDTWMNIFHHDRRIGFSHSVLENTQDGYLLKETVFMRLNTMGMVQDLNLNTIGKLNRDFTLSQIDFKLDSGRFRFSAKGEVEGENLVITTQSVGEPKRYEIKLKTRPYLAVGLLDAVRAAGLEAGKTYTFQVFDPASMAQQPASIKVIGPEDIYVNDVETLSTKVELSFKGVVQTAWIGEDGSVLKEMGLLGIYLEKSSREDVLSGAPFEAGDDLTELASVGSNVKIDDPAGLKGLRLRITGISLDQIHMVGGRQSIEGEDILVIKKESVSDIEKIENFEILDAQRPYLEPSMNIQSDHPRIKDLAGRIVSDKDLPLEKVKKLYRWVYDNIEKRPVVSMPDALSTLENRMGDCNEHAVLFAALARSAGIPTKVEAGLVYLKGRFYYHAWNLVYVGQWVTVDALFGQLPADVTHIRFITGLQEQQLDLMSVIGKIKLEILDSRNDQT